MFYSLGTTNKKKSLDFRFGKVAWTYQNCPCYKIQRNEESIEEKWILYPFLIEAFNILKRNVNISCTCNSWLCLYIFFCTRHPFLFRVFVIPQKALDFGSFTSKPGISLTASLRSTFSKPLLQRMSLPRPSVPCVCGCKDGDSLTGPVSLLLTICHRSWI